jgi:hypothetical protein
MAGLISVGAILAWGMMRTGPEKSRFQAAGVSSKSWRCAIFGLCSGGFRALIPQPSGKEVAHGRDAAAR